MANDKLWDDDSPEKAWDEDLDEDTQGLNALHPYWCAFCGEENEVFVDASGARQQRFTEDCQVCCRPNLITISIGYDNSVDIDAQQEYEA